MQDHTAKLYSRGAAAKLPMKGEGKMKTIEEMRKDGYPLRIKGNDGFNATLKGCQPLFNGDYMAIYRYSGGECCHDIEEIERCFEVIEQ